ncbi:response regulator transcription factor [Reinekea blandensis]|uniref:Response regulator consisting of a CheY-like receiver domain and a winged-helix DNA-binding domain n=1 Tax=Reinekea blandensis MED297 TaxID=314283 RepID=A4BA47_9GAMM|nr:response regulator transcription factor [Reinekea blandensis]EAR10803.1 Response regulator consisting of a CheY-like receiver domain and a winged-helix DNA-binding domain [Reinekea sp. MED297] [Reinekea blandensis MED297]
MSHCLLIADDPTLATTLSDRLERDDILCDYAPTRIKALDLVAEQRCHVILLDLDPTPTGGLNLLRKLRRQGIDTPVLLLSKRGSLNDKITGFNAGADDFLVKPVDIEEVFLRVRALAARRSIISHQLSAGPLKLDAQRRTCVLNRAPVSLTPITFRLLETLLRDSPNPVSQQQLTRAVWGDDLPDSNKLRVHMHRLRQSLKPQGGESLIKTVPGFGFAVDANRLETTPVDSTAN